MLRREFLKLMGVIAVAPKMLKESLMSTEKVVESGWIVPSRKEGMWGISEQGYFTRCNFNTGDLVALDKQGMLVHPQWTEEHSNCVVGVISHENIGNDRIAVLNTFDEYEPFPVRRV